MQRDMIGFVGQLARDYGDLVAYRIGPYRIYLVRHPRDIHEVLVKQARQFGKPGRVKRAWRKFAGDGLITSDGEFWLRQRRLVQPAFHPPRLRAYAGVVAEFAQRMLDRWAGRAEVNAAPEFNRVTLEVIAKTLFDAHVSEDVDRIGAAVDLIQAKAVRDMRGLGLPDWLPLPRQRRGRRAIAALHGLLGEIIRRRRAAGTDRGDLLSMLLLAADEGGGMTDRQALYEAMTLFLAGHETTAAALAWAADLLARHPDEQERLAEEVRRVAGDRPPGWDDLPHLVRTEMAFKEAMRLYPPVYFFSREVTGAAEVGGYQLPRGSYVHLFPLLVHRDPRWFDRPEEFSPDRFAPGEEDRLPPFAYFPFGGGPRLCVGKAFAMMNGVLILAAIVQRYRLAPAPGQGLPAWEAQITLAPKGGVRLVPAPRVQ
jgi:cytochrome P450